MDEDRQTCRHIYMSYNFVVSMDTGLLCCIWQSKQVTRTNLKIPTYVNDDLEASFRILWR